jgi:hypothetical protein
MIGGIMGRLFRIYVAVAGLLLCCWDARLSATEVPPGTTKADVAAIYHAFLGQWLGNDKSIVFIARSAEPPSSDDTTRFGQCSADPADEHARLVDTVTIENLGKVVGDLPRLRFVDPDTWQPEDPGKLIAKGQSVEAAVATGVGHALLTLSAITFNDKHDRAAFTFSSDCGALCGTGGTVVFKKTSRGWIRQESTCGNWIS